METELFRTKSVYMYAKRRVGNAGRYTNGEKKSCTGFTDMLSSMQLCIRNRCVAPMPLVILLPAHFTETILS